MSCPICGERCICAQPWGQTAPGIHTSVLIDPETPDNTEEQFSASLGTPAATAPSEIASQPFLDNSEIWRQEVASRVNAFCARRGRKRQTRTASLTLEFENPGASDDKTASQASDRPLVRNPETGHARAHCELPPEAQLRPDLEGSNIIKFPKPPVADPQLTIFAEELAEPIIEVPRILEAEPEDPALQFGGQPLPSITLEAPPVPPVTFPEPAVLSQRALAGVVDGLIVLVASVLFAVIASHFVVVVPHSRAANVTAAAILATFWAVYQYIFSVHSGRTPGMQIAGLELRTFDCYPVTRSLRRWRVVALGLSAVSLGMGFLWAIIDDDGLCWHDRISHTMLRPK